VGAIYVNYAATAATTIGGVLLLDWAVGLSLGQQLALGVALATLVPVLFFRYARSLWLCADHLLTTADRRTARTRRP
jgi:hypothetical protein